MAHFQKQHGGSTTTQIDEYGNPVEPRVDQYGNPDEYGNYVAPRVDKYGNPLGKHDSTATSYATTTRVGQDAYGHDYERKDHGATGGLRQQYGSNLAAQTDEYGNPVGPRVDEYGNPLGQHDMTATGYAATTGAGQGAYGHDYERKDHYATDGLRQQYGSNPAAQIDEYGNPVAPRVDEYGNPLGQHDTTATGYTATTVAGQGAYGHDYERKDHGATGRPRDEYGNPVAPRMDLRDEYGDPVALRVDQYGNQGAYSHDYERKDHSATGVLRQKYGSNPTAQTDEYGNPLAPRVDQYGNRLKQHDTTATGYATTTGAGQGAYGYEKKGIMEKIKEKLGGHD